MPSRVPSIKGTFQEVSPLVTADNFQEYVQYKSTDRLIPKALAFFNMLFRESESVTDSYADALAELTAERIVDRIEVMTKPRSKQKRVLVFGLDWTIEKSEDAFCKELAGIIWLWTIAKKGGMNSELRLRQIDGWVNPDKAIVPSFMYGPWRDVYDNTSEADVLQVPGIQCEPWIGSIIHRSLIAVIFDRVIPTEVCRDLLELSRDLSDRTSGMYSLGYVDLLLTAAPQLLNQEKAPRFISSDTPQMDNHPPTMDAENSDDHKLVAEFKNHMIEESARLLSREDPPKVYDYPFFDDRVYFDRAMERKAEQASREQGLVAKVEEAMKTAKDAAANTRSTLDRLNAAEKRAELDRADTRIANERWEAERAQYLALIAKVERMDAVITAHKEDTTERFEYYKSASLLARYRVLESARVWMPPGDWTVDAMYRDRKYRQGGNEAVHAANITLDLEVARNKPGEFDPRVAAMYGLPTNLLEHLSAEQELKAITRDHVLTVMTVWKNAAKRQLAVLTVHCYFWIQHQLCKPEATLLGVLKKRQGDIGIHPAMLPFAIDELPYASIPEYSKYATDQHGNVLKLSEIMQTAKRMNAQAMGRVHEAMKHRESSTAASQVHSVDLTGFEFSAMLRFCQVVYLGLCSQFQRDYNVGTGIKETEWDKLEELIGWNRLYTPTGTSPDGLVARKRSQDD